MPFFLMTTAAAGAVSNLASALAASAFVACVWMPVEKIVIC